MKLEFGKAALLIGAALVLAPLSLSAQDIRDLDDASSDVRIFTGEVSTQPVRYSFTIPPQTSLRIDVVPTGNSQLDPILSVTDIATGEVLAEDDDGGEGLASRARIYSEAGQQVEITVSAFAFFSGDETNGLFELQLRTSDVQPVPMRAAEFDFSVDGTLNGDGGHLYTIAGEEGQLLEVALMTNDESLDPLLSLYMGRGANGEPLTSNDDGGNGLNSLLRFVFPESGIYTIEANGYSDSTGDYTLRIAEAREPVLQSPMQAISVGETLSGRLGEGYEFGSLDPAQITYQLTPEAIAAVRAGAGEVTFNMTALDGDDSDFPSTIDAYLDLGFETPLGFASMMTDDDGGEGLNSRIAVDLGLLDEGGWLERLRLRASSIGAGGDYRIEMVEGMQEIEDYDFGEYEEGAEASRVLPSIGTVPAARD